MKIVFKIESFKMGNDKDNFLVDRTMQYARFLILRVVLFLMFLIAIRHRKILMSGIT